MKAPLSSRQQRRHFSNIALIMIAYYLLALLLYYVTALLTAAAGLQIPQTWQRFIFDDVPQALLILPLCAVLLRFNTFALPQEKKLGVRGFLKCIPICIALMEAGNFFSSLANSFVTAIRGEVPTNHLENVIYNSSNTAILLFVVIIAPVLEELLFRKFLIDALYPYGEATAVIVSGLIFGAFHGNFYQVFYAALVGGFFAIIYCRTGRIRYTVALHMLLNFFGSFVPLQLSSLTEARVTGADKLLHTVLSAVVLYSHLFLLLFLAILGVIFIRCQLKTFRFKKGTLPIQKWPWVVLVNPGMLLLIISTVGLFIVNL